MSKRYPFTLMICIALLINSLFGAVRPISVAQAAEAAKTGVNDAAPTMVNALPTCPCTIWPDTTVPDVAQRNRSDIGMPIEVGVKFRSDTSGYITGLRFYKGELNSGTHTGHLWDTAGNLLAAVTFTNETASGWQTASFASPVPVTANITYIASYFSPSSYFAMTAGGLATAVDNGPLHVPAGTLAAPNGVFRYNSAGFPDQQSNSVGPNYWVDVVFDTMAPADTTAPSIAAKSPDNGVTGVSVYPVITVKFSEAMDPASLNEVTFLVKGSGGVVVPASVTYQPGTWSATLDPTAQLSSNTTYTVTVVGGANGVKDQAGNPLAASTNWTFRTLTVPAAPADEGPGGPILVVTTAANPFSRYYTEILRAEGFNAYKAIDITKVTSTTLNSYSVVILGEMSLTTDQVTMFTDWVNGGGNLIAMRPDPQLAGLLGLTGPIGTRSDAYLLIDTSKAPGQGLVSETIQYHGTADLYNLNTAGGGTSIAALYNAPYTASTNPAVTLRSMPTGGQAAAFTYDLARSIVYTRQGNPAWAGQERDGQAPFRTSDMFFGGTGADPQADWVDLNKVAIPQADEQQRLLAKMIMKMTLDKMVLPHFWYLPNGYKAAVLMSGDDHNNTELTPSSVSFTPDRFNQLITASPLNCDPNQWQCVRASAHILSKNSMTPDQVLAYIAQGFEVGLHVDFGCVNYTSASVGPAYTSQLNAWKAVYAGAPTPSSSRAHCVVWSDWVSQAKAELASGIRLDMNYYMWPAGWIKDRPGMFTGSGFPMRFADTDGSQINVYQAATQMTDESKQTYPTTIDALLTKALGPEGYYGVFTANIHAENDPTKTTIVSQILTSAQSRNVPVISGSQLLKWVDARNNSSFTNMVWTPGATTSTLAFSVTMDPNATNLQVLLPTKSATGTLTSLTLDDGTGTGPVAVTYTAATIKGVEYAPFLAAAGTYTATYTYQASMDLPPTAVPDSYTVEQNKTLTVPAYGVLNNDIEPNGGSFTAIKVNTNPATPAHGTVTLNPNGSFTYTPANNYIGTDTFSYKANDGKADSNTVTVTITVTEANVAPVAVADAYSVAEGGTLTQAKPGVLSNDTDANTKDTLTASLVNGPSHGTLTLNPDGSFTYIVSDQNYNGPDSFTYRAYDGTTYSNDVTVAITVTPVNDQPVAVGESYTTDEDVTLTVPSGSLKDVLANDTDADTGTTLTAVKVTGPAHGTLTLNPDGSFTYTPTRDYNGSDSFTYKAYDGQLYSNVVTVSITINSVPDKPKGGADTLYTALNTTLEVKAPGLLANDYDGDKDPLTVSKVSDPKHGKLTLNSDGSFTYVPDAGNEDPDTFTYQVYDGTFYSDPITVTIIQSNFYLYTPMLSNLKK